MRTLIDCVKAIAFVIGLGLMALGVLLVGPNSDTREKR